MITKKLMAGICVLAVVSLLGISAAEAVTVTFTENGRTYTGSQWTYTPAANEFGPDILVSGVYQYGDYRDPWDGVGLSPTAGDPNAVGVIDLVVPTWTVDWMSIVSNTLYVEAYDSGGTMVDSFTRSGSGTFSGTDVLTGAISSIEFHDNGGQVAISTLTFELVPEPASMLILGCLGAGMAGARKLRRKK